VDVSLDAGEGFADLFDGAGAGGAGGAWGDGDGGDGFGVDGAGVADVGAEGGGGGGLGAVIRLRAVGGSVGGEVESGVAVGVEEAVGEIDADDDKGMDLTDAALGECGMEEAGEGDGAFSAGFGAEGHGRIFEDRGGVDEGDEAWDLGEEFAGEEEGPEVFATEFGFGVTGDAAGFRVGVEDDAIGGEMEDEAGKLLVEVGENIGRR
jgi:hypothetical protein